MAPASGHGVGPHTVRLSTEAVPVRERTAAFREFYGRQMLGLDIEPLREPLRAQVTLRLLPDFGVATVSSTAVRLARTKALLSNGEDTLGLLLNMSPTTGVLQQFGREVPLAPGSAVLLSNGDPGAISYPGPQGPSSLICVALPRARVQPLVRDLDSVLLQPIPDDHEGLRLFKHYLKALTGELEICAPELLDLMVLHAYDLLATMVGARQETAQTAKGRGVRAARMLAFKNDIRKNLHHADLTAGIVASRHGLTPRYVQMLFESDGTTFGEFVLEERLSRARRMLTNPSFADRSISAIAFDVGFGDLSYFNRTFRRRFGCTPSDARISGLGNE